MPGMGARHVLRASVPIERSGPRRDRRQVRARVFAGLSFFAIQTTRRRHAERVDWAHEQAQTYNQNTRKDARMDEVLRRMLARPSTPVRPPSKAKRSLKKRGTAGVRREAK